MPRAADAVSLPPPPATGTAPAPSVGDGTASLPPAAGPVSLPTAGGSGAGVGDAVPTARAEPIGAGRQHGPVLSPTSADQEATYQAYKRAKAIHDQVLKNGLDPDDPRRVASEAALKQAIENFKWAHKRDLQKGEGAFTTPTEEDRRRTLRNHERAKAILRQLEANGVPTDDPRRAAAREALAEAEKDFYWAHERTPDTPPPVPGALPSASVVHFADATNEPAARQAFDTMVREDKYRESGLFRNTRTGEYIIVQGRDKTVGVEVNPRTGGMLNVRGEGRDQRWKRDFEGALPDVGNWELVAHSHPSEVSTGFVDPVNEFPSGPTGDFAVLVAESARAGWRARESEISVLTEDGRLTTRFGFDPAKNKPYCVQRDGDIRREFTTLQDYENAVVGLFPNKNLTPEPVPGWFPKGGEPLPDPVSLGFAPAPAADGGEAGASPAVDHGAVTSARSGDEPIRTAACRALARVASALVARHGQVWGDRDTIAALALDLACNAHGSDVIGRLVDPLLKKAAATEPYTLLPRQELPVVMNTKGASASGKSTLRPRQRQLARDIGVRWSEFALISPDIWRKQLLDYGTLGPAYKYGGAFTGEELQIVDKKLDRYMAMKAERGEMTHLLIDRFRFDSFAPDSDEAGSNLLTRFGHDVYLFFMITPPEALVERAWKRGLELGRYKAVDDTLAHGIDAYTGMPRLIFTWATRSDKRVQFELLDNSVAAGERPRTVAFGSNRALNVLDVKSMLDIERFRRVNVDATSPDTLYADADLLRPEHNAGFLRQCLEYFPEVNFADQSTGRIYLTFASAAPVWCDRDALEAAVASTETRAGLVAAAPSALDRIAASTDGPRYLSAESGDQRWATVGAWGSSGNGAP
jgi:hypothetical protein